jgi:pilus assembly protein FimV
MVRKLALAVSIALGTLNAPVHALGLGELTSDSLLNQNFSGNINLLSVTPEEIDGIRVKLADADAFERAGVERPFYLSLLKFAPDLLDAGKPVIRVTSDFPIREPFLNFLVEVNWPNGRLLREYTVLLDPPTTTPRRPPAPVAPQVSTRPAAPPPVQAPVTQRAAPKPAPATPAAAAPVASFGGDEYGPVQANETAWSIAKQVRPGGVSMEQMMMALLAANPQAFIDNNINRLRQGRILRVPAIDEIQQLSRQQARQAYREQQDEWLARRDARLQAAAAEATQGDVEDGAGAAAGEPDDQLRIATARPEGEGEAGAGEDDATGPISDDLQSRLIVARENAETSRQEAETLRSEVDDLQQRLDDMQKLLTLKDDQLARLQDQVATESLGETEASTVIEQAADAAVETAELEPPAAEEVEPAEAVVTEVEPVLEEAASTDAEPMVSDALDEVMADVETAAETAVDEVAEEVVTAFGATPDFVPPPGYQIPDVTALVDVDAIVAGEVEPAVPDDGAAAVAAVEEAVEPQVAAVEPAAVESQAPAQVPESDAAVEAPAEDAAEVAATTEAAEPPAPMEPTKPAVLPPALATLVEQNIVPIAGGGVALIGLIGWLATRRRKQDDGQKPGATLPDVAQADLPGVDEPGVTGDALNELPDSAFLDEFSPGDLGSLQDETGEVDPVSEADVYIAYGRYQQAKELLTQAMERDPGRLALKHKLLEVHYATRDGEAFGALAQEMVDAGQDAADEAAWARAQDMGRELQPANPMFAAKEEDSGRSAPVAAAATGAAAGGAIAAAVVSASERVDDDTLSIGDLDLSDLEDEYEVDKPGDEPVDAPSEVSITLDLDDSESELAAVKDDLEMPELPESLSLDDVESLDLDTQETAADGTTEELDAVSDSFDLDSVMQEAEAALDSGDTSLNLDSEFTADELQAELDELSDLSVLDSELEDDQLPPAELESNETLDLVTDDLEPMETGSDQPLELEPVAESEPLELETAPESETSDAAAEGSSADEDDVATKLDLARAYVEMGDQDGARSILQEVVGEGSEAQKGEAQKLLDEIG